MKRFIYLLLFFLASFLSTIMYSYDPLLVVVIMVKNEESVIIKTLQPFYDGGITSFLVFDTGSTDNTMGEVELFYHNNPAITGHVVCENFIDFATSRNHALNTARQLFPDAVFFIMPDAEWYIHNAQQLYEFCQKEQLNLHIGAYHIRLVSSSSSWYQARLIRAMSDAYFKGAVHEAVLYPIIEKIPNEIYFAISPSRTGIEKSRQRWLRDRDILLKSFNENPEDPRTSFYLGQTYECLGDYIHAYYWYHHRSLMPGWDEENFMTYHHLGRVTESLAILDPTHYSWDDAQNWYLTAYNYRPWRIEPLYAIAQHYWDIQQYGLCYLFSRQACLVDYPDDDTLFVQKDVYHWQRFDLLARSAWYVGEYVVGKEAAERAVRNQPEKEYLIRNLQFYANTQKDSR